MLFRGRTVLTFILVTLVASCIMTVMMIGPKGLLLKLINEPREGIENSTPTNDNKSSVDKTAELTAAEIAKIQTVYRIINSKFMTEVDRQEILNGAIQGMLSVLEDPYTTYMDPETSKQFEQEVDSFFTGIGAEVSLDNGKVVVVAPIKGSPAEKAGLRSKDLILSVNGESLEGLSLTDAVMKIRGPKGTQAKLEIQRSGNQSNMELIVVRDEIDLETVFSEMMEDGIGKIEIRQFSLHTVASFKEQLADLESKGMKGLVIDVRNNPGGYLQGVLEILNVLVPKGNVSMQSEYRNDPPVKTVSEGPGRTYPMTVLINGGSASASEILAAAIQQSAKGKLIGEKSFGKGTIQTQYDGQFTDGSLLKISIGKWLTPNGKWIHEKGILPDYEIKQPEYFYVSFINREQTWKLSDNNDDIKNTQIILYGLGYDPGRKDGYFNEQTQAALKLFQEKIKLNATGELNVETIEQLEREIIQLMVKPENDLQLQEAIRIIKRAL
ncbi:MAG: S41 family peptidase [Paenibacillaceae bacterium]